MTTGSCRAEHDADEKGAAAHRPGTDLGIVFPDFDSGRSRWLGVMA